MLTVNIGLNGIVTGDLYNQIGYMGEGNNRQIKITYPQVPDATSYKVKCLYKNTLKEYTLTSSGIIEIPAEFMHIDARLEFKFEVYRNTKLVFFSHIWNLTVSRYLTFHELS